jgi:hypothetical protein
LRGDIGMLVYRQLKVTNEDNDTFGDQTDRAPGGLRERVPTGSVLSPEFLDRLSWRSATLDQPEPGHVGDWSLE